MSEKAWRIKGNRERERTKTENKGVKSRWGIQGGEIIQ